MRKTKIVKSKASKNHMSKFEQLQHIKNLTKTFIQQQFKSGFNYLPKFNR